jgi:hypothetical protein
MFIRSWHAPWVGVEEQVAAIALEHMVALVVAEVGRKALLTLCQGRR